MEFKISRLRVQCMLRVRFFGSLLHNCKISESDQIPTACIDKRLNILMNPKFMNTLDEDEQLFVLGHEVLHGALLHVHRIFEFADPRLYKVGNIAADYLANYILVEMGMKMPKIVTLYDPKYNPNDYTLEKLVKELMDNQDTSDSQSGDQGDGDKSEQGQGIGDGSDIMEGEGSEISKGELRELESKIKTSLAAAVMQAKKQGNLPGSLERFCNELLKPRINWRHESQDCFNFKVKGERNWARPNRRHAWRGVYCPVNTSLGCGHIGMAVDLSGSIGEQEIKIWWSELKYIFAACKPRKLTICWFDTRTRIDVFEEGDFPEELRVPSMGGGTDFHAPINFFNNDVEDDIDGLVFMTDMWGDWPDKEPSYPMIVLSTTPNKEAPYGKTVYCELGDTK